MYAKFFKRFVDFCVSLLVLIILSPMILILALIGAIIMRCNPFFVQLRPGLNEKMVRLIKFRTMTCEKDKNGNIIKGYRIMCKQDDANNLIVVPESKSEKVFGRPFADNVVVSQ